jgi:DNA-binding MarR family transcriptional regulator
VNLATISLVQGPDVGEGFRGESGHVGYLLQQAALAFRAAADEQLRPLGLSLSLFSVITVLTREPGASASDLARMCHVRPQSINGLLQSLEATGYVVRRDHPVHGRVRQVFLTEEGERLVEQARPAVDGLEASLDDGFDEAERAAVRRWLVSSARRVSPRRRTHPQR